ncbi:TPA: hypothetical protein N0F65_010332 [Lagenidium giganteum]|uniref:GIY-YIG domain-containing protein n=1 Tax=Lagenidium giganteum TaxID=4803 RepID=A0AAV2Z5X4_9STRA|nr:TPA: hypothetical protein N0F65_010332 [Lagenidium giganteum]
MTETRIGRIYKIVCSKSNYVYFGSTFNVLRTRMAQHKDHFNRGRCLGDYDCFARHGWDSLHIILIAEYEVVDRKQLLMYEQLYINRVKACNKTAAFVPLSKSNQMRYRYKTKSNAAQSRRVVCDCGSEMRRDSLPDHLRTKKHQQWASQ